MPAAANLSNLTPKPAENALASLPGAAELFASLVAGAAPQQPGAAPVVPAQNDGASVTVSVPVEPEDEGSDAAILLPLIEQQRAQMPAPPREALPETLSPTAPEALPIVLTPSAGREDGIAERPSVPEPAPTTETPAAAVQVTPSVLPPKADEPAGKAPVTPMAAAPPTVEGATMPVAVPAAGVRRPSLSPAGTTAGAHTVPLAITRTAVPTEVPAPVIEGARQGQGTVSPSGPEEPAAVATPKVIHPAAQGPEIPIVEKGQDKHFPSQAAPVSRPDDEKQVSPDIQPVKPAGSSATPQPGSTMSAAPVAVPEVLSAPPAAPGSAVHVGLPAQPKQAGPTMSAAPVAAREVLPAPPAAPGPAVQAGLPAQPKQNGETALKPTLDPGGSEAGLRAHPLEAAPAAGAAKPVGLAASEQPMRAEVIRALSAAAEALKTPASTSRPAEVAPKVSGDPAVQVMTNAGPRALPATMKNKAAEPTQSPRIIGSRTDQQVELKTAVEVPAPAATERPAAAPLSSPALAMAAAPQPAMPAPAPNLAAALAGQVLDMSRDSAWIDQLARDITRTAAGEGGMRFRLAPETLGELRVEISQSERGAHVRLHVTSEAAQQALAEAQPKLAAEARAQGLRIAETEISFAGGQSDARDTSRHAQQQPEHPPRAYRANSNPSGGAGASPDLPDRDGPRRHDRYA